MERIRIVLAEDHALVREGTRRILEQHLDLSVVGEAGNGEEALALVERLHPHVVVLDVRMPGLNGIEVARRIKEHLPGTQIVVLTAYDDDDYILALMDAGVAGYLLKTSRASELVEAVRNVHQGEVVLHPTIARKVARLWARQRPSSAQQTKLELSPREQQVLELAAKGLRNRAIAERLGISVRTVEGHFNSVLTKLGVSSRIEAVLAAMSRQGEEREP